MRHALFLVGSLAAVPAAAQQPTPLTIPERTDFGVTSTTADVAAFLDTLQALGAPIAVSTMGTSALGTPLLFVVASDPRVTSAAEARRAGKLVLYLQANIHGGEVEGKEAVQQLLREIAGPERSLLDRLVILVAPVYNPDGNDALGPQERNRSQQNGPPAIGLRPDGRNYDLNRDYLKAEAPETRASLAAVYTRWDPAIMMDLHTTDGTRHGYLLTYSPPLDPNAPETPLALVRDRMLPAIRHTLAERYQEPVFDYGNVREPLEPEAWTTYSPLAWYGTNYVGLRGRIAILAEAYSHADFRTRVRVTHDFVLETLRYAAGHAEEIRQALAAADRTTTLEGAGAQPRPSLGVAFEPASRGTEPVVLEVLRPTGETARNGRPRLQVTGTTRTVSLPIFDRFRPTATRPLPAGYIVPAAARDLVDLLRLHGIAVERLAAPWRDTVEVFRIGELTRAEQPFQGHQLLTIAGDYTREARTVPAGAFYVSTAQPLGRVVFTLLEPEGAGLARWNAFDHLLAPEFGGPPAAGREFPVWRTTREPSAPRRTVGGS